MKFVFLSTFFLNQKQKFVIFTSQAINVYINCFSFLEKITSSADIFRYPFSVRKGLLRFKLLTGFENTPFCKGGHDGWAIRSCIQI
jgi:hypothetical protein